MIMKIPIRRLFGRRLVDLAVGLLALSGLTACGGEPAPPGPGDAAPAFELPASDGSRVALADFKDRSPVLLYFHMAVG
jgi:hypothetical protein